MRGVYEDGLGSRAVLIFNEPGSYTIERIDVPEHLRNQGRGSWLLDWICADADREDVVLVLSPQSSDPKMGQEKLEQWYQSRGFWPEDSFDIYVRRP